MTLTDYVNLIGDSVSSYGTLRGFFVNESAELLDGIGQEYEDSYTKAMEDASRGDYERNVRKAIRDLEVARDHYTRAHEKRRWLLTPFGTKHNKRRNYLEKMAPLSLLIALAYKSIDDTGKFEEYKKKAIEEFDEFSELYISTVRVSYYSYSSATVPEIDDIIRGLENGIKEERIQLLETLNHTDPPRED